MTPRSVHDTVPNETATVHSIRRKMRRNTMMLCSLALGLMGMTLAVNAQEPGKHIHGQAELNIAIEPGHLTLMLLSPLDNILGFEHAPRTAKEKAQVETAQQRLNHGDQLFALDDAASCKVEKIVSEDLHSHQRENNTAHHKHGHTSHDNDTHTDAELNVDFACASGTTPQFVDASPLFDAFVRLQTLQVQIAGPNGQRGLTVPRTNPRIALPKSLTPQ